MVFSSLSFLYFFFPLVFILYFAIKNRTWRNGVLLIASLLFYSWGEPRRISLMILATFAAYVGGLLMELFKERKQEKRRKITCAVSVALIILNLLVFKYFNFFADNLGVAFGVDLGLPEIVLPIGISFYTFQILSYVIDLYRGEVKVQRNAFYLLLYVSFFPQLIAGPIVRYSTVEEELLTRKENLSDVKSGVNCFIIGLAKKVLIANHVGAIAEIIYKGDTAVFGGGMYWIAALAYTLQLYFDFSGYSDMAIGLGRVFGFHFPENFNYPYISCSITEFWKRWHVSLSSWFRDYVYIPLGGNRVAKSRWVLNLLVVWGITGFWHGASWNFLLWGLYYGVLLIVEKLLLGKVLQRIPKIFGWVYAMFFVTVGWVIFNVTDLPRLLQVLEIMFTMPKTDWIRAVSGDLAILRGLVYLPLGILCSFPILKKVSSEKNLVGTFVSYGVHLILLVLCVITIVSTKYNPFIYFRF